MSHMQEGLMSTFDQAVIVNVPGKLFFAGEYAVTRPEGLALVTTIATDFTVKISAGDRSSHLQTNVAMADYDFSINKISVTSDNPWNFALTALKKTLEFTDGSISKVKNVWPEVTIEITSDMGFGDRKKGYGSSASVVCGVVNATNTYFKLGLTLAERFVIAAEAHYEVQGSGSMGDIAAIMYGGSVFYKNRTQVLPLDMPWATYVVQTQKAAKTSEKLKIELSDDFYQTSDHLVRALTAAIAQQDFPYFKEKLLENQKLLLHHIPEGYMTDKLSLALKMINAYPEFAGKISGAGFGENVILFAENEAPIKVLQKKLEDHGIHLFKAEISEKNT